MAQILIQSKVEDKVNQYYKAIMTSLSRVNQASIQMNAHQAAIGSASDDIRLKNALLQSGTETLQVETNEMKEFIEENQGK